jgi:hypothetical protein
MTPKLPLTEALINGIKKMENMRYGCLFPIKTIGHEKNNEYTRQNY